MPYLWGAIPLSPLGGSGTVPAFKVLKCESESMFGINHWELLIVLVIALVLFGHRLPSMMRSLGKSVTEFKKGVQGVEEDVESAGKDEPRSKSKSDERAESRSDD